MELRPKGLMVVREADSSPGEQPITASTLRQPSKRARATTVKRTAASTPPATDNRRVGKRLLNVGETAQYLGLQVETVYKKARLRELPFVKVGRALRFDVEALGRFIEEHTVEIID